MTAPASPDLVRVGNLTLVGVSHYRYEFAVLVRRALLAEPYDCVAVEVPRGFGDALVTAVRRLPRPGVILFAAPEREDAAFVIEGSDGVIEAARTAVERGLPLECLDPVAVYPAFRDGICLPAAGPTTVTAAGTAVPVYRDEALDPGLTAGLEPAELLRLLQRIPDGLRLRDGVTAGREQFIAARLQTLAAQYEKVFYAGSLARLPGLVARLGSPQALPLLPGAAPPAASGPLHHDACKFGFTEFSRLTARYEAWRADPGGEPLPDRHTALLALMKNAADHYARATRAEVPDYVRVTWAKFLRKWLAAEGRVLPDQYHLVAAARAALDEDFAFHVLEYLADYPWPNPAGDPKLLRIEPEQVFPSGRGIVLHRKLRGLFDLARHRRLRAVRGSAMKKKLKEQWAALDPGNRNICSYPPEDLVIERWGGSLMRHANHRLQTVRATAEPFVADFGDGPDLRATLRRAHERRLYVRTGETGDLEFGSLVIVFDPDEREARYPYENVWLGEHHQESDMAFYATAPGDEVIGPGISRLEYGGVMMTYPPLRLNNIWSDPAFGFIPTRAEKLLVAGIVYAEKPGIIHLAKKPPARRWKQLAQRMGKRIIYVPLGSLNPLRLKRMRRFHLLKNRTVRAWADDYLRPDR